VRVEAGLRRSRVTGRYAMAGIIHLCSPTLGKVRMVPLSAMPLTTTTAMAQPRSCISTGTLMHAKRIWLRTYPLHVRWVRTRPIPPALSQQYIKPSGTAN